MIVNRNLIFKNRHQKPPLSKLKQSNTVGTGVMRKNEQKVAPSVPKISSTKEVPRPMPKSRKGSSGSRKNSNSGSRKNSIGSRKQSDSKNAVPASQIKSEKPVSQRAQSDKNLIPGSFNETFLSFELDEDSSRSWMSHDSREILKNQLEHIVSEGNTDSEALKHKQKLLSKMLSYANTENSYNTESRLLCNLCQKEGCNRNNALKAPQCLLDELEEIGKSHPN